VPTVAHSARTSQTRFFATDNIFPACSVFVQLLQQFQRFCAQKKLLYLDYSVVSEGHKRSGLFETAFFRDLIS
jgi:hypothetical protein